MKWFWSRNSGTEEATPSLNSSARAQLSGDAAELAQKLLGEATSSAEQAERSFKRQALCRKIPAYLIKAVALFGGLSITVMPGPYVPVAGLVITAAVLLDQLLSNYKRMIVYTIAHNAVRRTLRRIEAEYNDNIIHIVNVNTQPKGGKEAKQMLIDLARRSSRALRDEMDRIHTAVDQANVDFLRALNVDQPTQTHIPPPSASPPSALPPPTAT